jgi:hypothetical protein
MLRERVLEASVRRSDGRRRAGTVHEGSALLTATLRGVRRSERGKWSALTRFYPLTVWSLDAP